jgi:hypothetical protein
MAKARVGLATIGVPCACGCGPFVHRHAGSADHHCGLCGADVCRAYRRGGPQPAVTRIPDPARIAAPVDGSEVT